VSAGDRLGRLLALLPWLTAHPGVSWAEAAAEFGITEQQLVADIETLFVCGLPGYLPGDLIEISYEGGTIQVFEDAGLSRPLRLNPDEATALVVALRTLADLPGLRGSAALHGALAKLERAVGDAAAANVTVDVDAERAVVETVQAALHDGKRLHLRYYVPARDETTERDVDPMRVLIFDGRAYLEGWCRSVEAVRLFRLDRVDEVAVLAVDSVLPPEAEPRDLEKGLYQPAPDDPVVELLLAPSARWIADYYPTEATEEADEGALRVTLRVSDDGWLRRLMLRSGGAAQVLGPADLVAAVRADAEAALMAYSD
jgi:proteasome accessory factor C